MLPSGKKSTGWRGEHHGAPRSRAEAETQPSPGSYQQTPGWSVEPAICTAFHGSLPLGAQACTRTPTPTCTHTPVHVREATHTCVCTRVPARPRRRGVELAAAAVLLIGSCPGLPILSPFESMPVPPQPARFCPPRLPWLPPHRGEKWSEIQWKPDLERALRWGGKWPMTAIFISIFLRPRCPLCRGVTRTASSPQVSGFIPF